MALFQLALGAKYSRVLALFASSSALVALTAPTALQLLPLLVL